MNDLPSLFFSFKGRISRTVFWVSMFIWTLVFELVVHLDLFTGAGPVIDWVSTIIIIALMWPEVAIQAKRWHDRNKSAWWVLICFVPIAGSIWMLIELGFLGPVDEGNQY